MHLPDLEFRMRANSPSVTQFVRELPWHSVFSAFHWLPFLCSLLSASALSLSLCIGWQVQLLVTALQVPRPPELTLQEWVREGSINLKQFKALLNLQRCVFARKIYKCTTLIVRTRPQSYAPFVEMSFVFAILLFVH